ncbi:TPR repeat-containing protein (fragment) [uncultured Eubacteriales bacterium]|uniref:TPR repeat-containing protein n=1 Tax=uncultured Eubacteriales bacterium TaxID=172733 RepID=A0A212JXI7_9FIRM
MKLFPEDNAIKTFYAMTLYNLGEFSSAMKMLLTNLADTSLDENIKQYGKAIKLYADDLDKIW